MITYTIETLYHFSCEKCKKWWSIGDQIEVKVMSRWNGIGQLFLLFLMLPLVIIKRKINGI